MQSEWERLLDGIALTALIFWGPSLQTGGRPSVYHFRDKIAEVRSLLPEASADAARDLIRYLDGFPDAQALENALEQVYVRLFVNDLGGAAVDLYESCYEEDRRLMGAAALRMRERFRARGLELAGREGTPPDHLSFELEYLGVLLEQGLTGEDPTALAEARVFLTDELLPWTGRLRDLLCGKSEPFYGEAAQMLVGLLETCSRMLGK